MTLNEREVMPIDSDGIEIRIGQCVVAEGDNGYVVEGNVVEIQPYGCPFIDPEWNDFTVVIDDNGSFNHWRPSKVSVL